MSTIWAFLNSPVGISLIVAILGFVLGRIFIKKPTWQVIYDQYKAVLVDAIKAAEKAIPDDTANSAVKKLDIALKYLSTIIPEVIAKTPTGDLQQAISQVHADIEGKLK